VGVIERVLVANRGEIARRVIRGCRALGIGAVAVYSDADAGEPHVHEADASVRLGPAPAPESYLDIDRVVAAARAQGCDAVHPGYGFLAESAAFARAVVEAGLAFVGPSAEVIELMGDKAAAKRTLAQAGVPVVPGEDRDDLDHDDLVAAAQRIGFPLLVKAVAGGGGKGMRAVHGAGELDEALAGARREAAAAFGDDRVLLERLVSRPRHVEIQVLADRYGQVVHLLERECSVQRRHQKVVEEAPSPAVDAALRERMGAAAVRAAEAVGYEGAGTVEFLLDATSVDAAEPAFFFMEMNTRLQVEHPVTEMVTGLDLVALQLQVAAGKPLPITQDDVRVDGHAIEVRLYAEDPVEQLPQVGEIVGLDLPSGPGIRVDAGIARGSRVTRHYDPMLGKLVVHAPDRPAACERLTEALAATSVRGVTTNLELLAAIVGHERFRAGALTTSFIPDHLGSWRPSPAPPVSLVAAADTACQAHLGMPRSGDPTSPWDGLGPFRPGGVGGWRVNFTEPTDSSGTHREVRLRERLGERTAELDGEEQVVPAPAPPTDRTLGVDGSEHLWVHAEGRTAHLVVEPATRHGDAAAPSGVTSFTSPMPGSVLALPVSTGDRVAAGTTLALVEAMKMEHPVVAPTAGTIGAIHVQVGDPVDGGSPLLEFEPSTEAPEDTPDDEPPRARP
jgi:acetyl-CoA/propionyl-CoA carboxylase, biotin carboxylase, biotin carboxyl carrier protein